MKDGEKTKKFNALRVTYHSALCVFVTAGRGHYDEYGWLALVIGRIIAGVYTVVTDDHQRRSHVSSTHSSALAWASSFCRA